MIFKHEIKGSKDNYPGPGSYEKYGDFYKYNDRLWDSSYNNKNSKKDSYKSPEKKKRIMKKNKKIKIMKIKIIIYLITLLILQI